MKIHLYSTLGCHLCEQAKSILWPLLSRYEYRLIEIDIATDDDLIERYGTRIPVLAVSDRVGELNWPFNSEEVEHFLGSKL
ncbi:MAG: glutaredoxin family protein [Cellvibrio sp.]